MVKVFYPYGNKGLLENFSLLDKVAYQAAPITAKFKLIISNKIKIVTFSSSYRLKVAKT